jgi:hypothetical protein
MAIKVNGGIINHQTLAGSLRYFKMTGPFAYTKSDGTVNLAVSTTGGTTPVTSYFQVGDQRPVPNSAAELALREISKQADITIIGLFPAVSAASGTTAIHFACSATGFGWGSNTPDYTAAPGPEDLTAAAPAMQAAVRALAGVNVPTTAGVNPTPPAAPNTNAPATTAIVFTGVTITEVTFNLA